MKILRVAATVTALVLAGCGLSPALFPQSASSVQGARTDGRWWVVELHTHSKLEGGKQTVAELIKLAKEQGADALAITEHDTLSHFKTEAFQAEHELTMLHSYEWTSKKGHLGIHGPGLASWADTIPNTEAPITGGVAKNAARGATVIAHHPFAPGDSHWTGGYDPRLSALEIWSGHYLVPDVDSEAQAQSYLEEDAAKKLALATEEGITWWNELMKQGLKVNITAASDYHRWPQSVTSPCTLVFAADKSEASILAAIRAGRTIGVRTPKSARLYLEADANRSGAFSALPGDAVRAYGAANIRLTADKADKLTVRVFTDKGLATELKVEGDHWTKVVTLPAGTRFVWGRLDGSLTQFKLQALTGAIYLDGRK